MMLLRSEGVRPRHRGAVRHQRPQQHAAAGVFNLDASLFRDFTLARYTMQFRAEVLRARPHRRARLTVRSSISMATPGLRPPQATERQVRFALKLKF
jgi:hypothetical protein